MFTKEQLLKMLPEGQLVGFKPVESKKEKALQNALSGYAKGCRREDAVAIYDTTIVGNGKKGYLLATDGMYGYDFHTFKKDTSDVTKIPFENLQDFYRFDQGTVEREKKDTLADVLYRAVYADGQSIVIYCSGAYSKYLVSIMEQVLAAQKDSGKEENHKEENHKEEAECREELCKVKEQPGQSAGDYSRNMESAPEKPVHEKEPAPVEESAPEESVHEKEFVPAEEPVVDKSLRRKPVPVENEPVSVPVTEETVTAPIEKKSAVEPVAEKATPAPQDIETKMETTPETDEERYRMGMELFRAGKYDEAFPLIKRVCPPIGARKNKYPDGQAVLGRMYEQGWGTESNVSLARRHYNLAAQNGDRDGMIGYVCLVSNEPNPSSENCETALNYAKQLMDEERVSALEKKLLVAQQQEAAAAEQKKAEEECERLFLEGSVAYQEENFGRALELFEKVAEQGNAYAQFNCGVMYYFGEGTQPDKAKALYWYEKAAEQGNVKAQFGCGVMYGNGIGTELDKAKALYWYEKAAEQGHVKAQFGCGAMYDSGIGTELDKAKALYWYEKAAEQGHVDAQFKCGWMYDEGKGTEADKAKALYWYEKVAEQGNAYAQFNCGVMYEKGEGTQQDKEKALYWYEKAAEQGEADAQLRCGFMYRKLDKMKALYWYEKAAEQGEAKAQFNCGVMYYDGEGTESDKAKALYWYEKAAEQGHEDAKRALEHL